MIYHKLNMNYFDEKFKKNIKFKPDRNLIEKEYLKFKNITKTLQFFKYQRNKREESL